MAVQKITYGNKTDLNTTSVPDANKIKANDINEIKNVVNNNADLIYPVGSIYMSVNNTNPSTLFGGTWEQIQDKFLLSAGTTYNAGATGGSATHTLSVSQLPTHNHDGLFWGSTSGSAFVYTGSSGSNTVFDLADPGVNTKSYNYNGINHIVSGNTGEGASINHMPPYLVVYMWVRTA